MTETWGPYPMICECGKKHILAFYYLLKRRGDNPKIEFTQDDQVIITRERNE